MTYPSSLSMDLSQMISKVAFAKALHFDSLLDLKTTTSFIAHHEIRLGPKKTVNPPIERLPSKHPAQSELEKALTRVDGDLLNVR